MGGSKKVGGKQISELDLPGVEIVGASQDILFTLSRASQLPYNAKSKTNSKKNLIIYYFPDFLLFPFKGDPLLSLVLRALFTGVACEQGGF